jgi:hypothetical protein
MLPSQYLKSATSRVLIVSVSVRSPRLVQAHTYIIYNKQESGATGARARSGSAYNSYYPNCPMPDIRYNM